VKRKKSGFTLVELLTVLAIISLLVGLILPSLTMVRKLTKQTRQKAQFATIEMGLLAFKSDYGDYPPSEQFDPLGNPYCGAQKLAEALVGWDLMGFHPKSAWRVDGFDANGGVLSYDPVPHQRLDPDGVGETLKERRGPYIDSAKSNAFTLGESAPGQGDGLFANTNNLDPSRFVICDSFGVKTLTIGTKTFKVGTPILYYKANTSRKVFKGAGGSVPPRFRIYNIFDNIELLELGVLPDANPAKEHPLFSRLAGGRYFYSDEYKVVDPVATMALRNPPNDLNGPAMCYRPDSYILISAGYDGLYGTSDDICNFDN